MNAVFTQLLAFVGKHWLRVGLVLMTLFLLTRKQIDLSVQLGQPRAQPSYQSVPVPPHGSGNLQKPVPIQGEATSAPASLPRSQQLNVISSSSNNEATASALVKLHRTDEGSIQAFLDRFGSVAKTEQKRYGIPASITLANGLLQSRGGTRSDLNSHANYFNLPCTSDWRGQTFSAGSDCLRVYPNAWTSFRDHSLFITTGRFAQLTSIAQNDYHSWASAMEQTSYPNSNDLANQIVSVIEEYGLAKFDK
ncbi:MAG: glucosaminidase domain-containing protein [Bacteroidota bacterium]